MSTPKILTAFATVLGALALFALDSTFAQDAGPYGPAGSRPFLRRDLSYHAWYYDGRDDNRDFPTNGFFPGDFAAILRTRQSGLPDCSAPHPTKADIIKPVARDKIVPTTPRPAISWI